jgi:hypothetical protein
MLSSRGNRQVGSRVACTGAEVLAQSRTAGSTNKVVNLARELKVPKSWTRDQKQVEGLATGKETPKDWRGGGHRKWEHTSHEIVEGLGTKVPLATQPRISWDWDKPERSSRRNGNSSVRLAENPPK